MRPLLPLIAGVFLLSLAYYDTAINLITPVPSGNPTLCFTVPALFGYCMPADFYFFWRWAVILFYVILGFLFLTRKWGEEP